MIDAVFAQIFGQPKKPDPKPPTEAEAALMNRVINKYAPLVTADCPLEWEKVVRNKDTGRRYRVTVKLEEVEA